MADLDEIFRTLQQQQNYLAEVSKKIETDIEAERERQLAAQRDREREEAKKRAEVEARNEIFRKQREEALKQRMERLAVTKNAAVSFEAPVPILARSAPAPAAAPAMDSSDSGPLRLPSYNPSLYESLRQSRRGRDAEDGPSLTDLLEISDPQITAEEAWELLPPPNLPPPPPPPPAAAEDSGDEDSDSGSGRPSDRAALRHSYSAPRAPASLPSPVSPRDIETAAAVPKPTAPVVAPAASEPTAHLVSPIEAIRTARSASEARSNLVSSSPDTSSPSPLTRPRGAALSGPSDPDKSAGSAPPRPLGSGSAIAASSLSPAASSGSGSAPASPANPNRSSGGLFGFLRGGKRSADPAIEAALDAWTRRLTKPSKAWHAPVQDKATAAQFLDMSSNEFTFEWSGALAHDGTGTLPIDDESELVPHYETIFYGKEHTNYIALDAELGPLVVSAENATGRRLRCIIRTKAGEERVLVPGITRKRKELEKIFPNFGRIVWLVLQASTAPKLCQDLLSYERHLVVHNFKFGVLYWKTGQTAEDEFYQNNTPDLSPAFNQFVSLLGDVVPLINWSRFKGGLRTTDNSTGTHSVYTDYRGFEIMYHIAPMIPNPSIDKQQLDRKRHLGNDIVVLIFRDSDNTQPFNPKIMRSQVNQIFLIVQPVSPDKYRVGVMAKSGIPVFGPPLPPDGAIAASALRAFLLTKMINGERAAMQGPDFASKLVNSRQKLLTHMYNNHKDSGKP